MEASHEPDYSPSLDPLTRKNAVGDTYSRAPDVDRQIMQVLVLPPETIRNRVAIEESKSSDFVSEECLIYLLRHYFRRGDTATVNILAEELLRRCAPIVLKHLRTFGPQALEEGQSEIVERLFRKILDISTDKADFFQVRFWLAMERLCVQEFNRQLKRRRREMKGLSVSQLQLSDGDEDEAGERVTGMLTEKDERRLSVPSDEQRIVDDDLRRAALTQLHEPLRSAFWLRHYEGWPIEDQNPAVATISRHFVKTPRTIRNWLARADEILARWRGGQK